MYGSSPNMKMLLKLVTEFYCGSNITLHDDGSISNSNGKLETVWWKKGKRFYFGKKN